MLIKCPECELQVSDKAITCPHCGYPLKPDVKPRKPRNKSNKRKRLPNGFGQISEIKNRNLRKPFRAMVTVGKTSTGRPICKPLKPNAFFETYNDAYSALIEYNKNPYDIEKTITVKELYERWSKEYFEKISDSAVRKYKSSFDYSSAIHNMKAVDVRIRHIKGCMEKGTKVVRGVERNPSPAIKNAIKMMFSQMFDYALEYELIEKNYARTFKISGDIKEEAESKKQKHIAFTSDELVLLWDNMDTYDVIEIILIQCYSGWRPNELLSLRIENVNLKDGYFKGGMKTRAGKNRVVPIHPIILPIVKKHYDYAMSKNSDYLIINKRTDKRIPYVSYLNKFNCVIENLKLSNSHKPHDGRVTFVTLAKNFNVDEYAIKYMVGHSIDDITEDVYADRTDAWLTEEIEKIKRIP